MFSIILGITNIIMTIKPTINPMGLFKSDIMEKGSLILKKVEKENNYRGCFDTTVDKQETKKMINKTGSSTNLIVRFFFQRLQHELI
jgi:hypothetical protein